MLEVGYLPRFLKADTLLDFTVDTSANVGMSGLKKLVSPEGTPVV
jgi:hypothetical protein